jgi:hypothetical protein
MYTDAGRDCEVHPHDGPAHSVGATKTTAADAKTV